MTRLLVAAAVRLLPAPRREWGEALLAELDDIGPRAERWRFAGRACAAIAAVPAVLRRAVYVLLPIAIVAVASRRWSVGVLLGALALVAEAGIVGPLGPVAITRAARFARLVAYALVGPLAAEAAWFLAHRRGDEVGGAVVLGVALGGCLAGALAVTGHRSVATPRALAAGLGGGAAIAGSWAAIALLWPPIPPHIGLAVILLGAGVAGIGIAMERRRGAAAAWCAATTAGTTGALLVLNLVMPLSAFGADRLIPHLMPPALPPAVQVAESRIELPDRYLWLLLLAWFVALAQWVAARPALEDSEPDGLAQQQDRDAAGVMVGVEDQ